LHVDKDNGLTTRLPKGTQVSHAISPSATVIPSPNVRTTRHRHTHPPPPTHPPSINPFFFTSMAPRMGSSTSTPPRASQVCSTLPILDFSCNLHEIKCLCAPLYAFHCAENNFTLPATACLMLLIGTSSSCSQQKDE
jgi:hypothetical protein